MKASIVRMILRVWISAGFEGDKEVVHSKGINIYITCLPIDIQMEEIRVV